MSDTEPTIADVLTRLDGVSDEIKGLRRNTAEALASLSRTVESKLQLTQSSIRLDIRELDSHLVRSDTKNDLSVAQLRSELHDVSEIAQELLALAHTHTGETDLDE